MVLLVFSQMFAMCTQEDLGYLRYKMVRYIVQVYKGIISNPFGYKP